MPQQRAEYRDNKNTYLHLCVQERRTENEGDIMKIHLSDHFTYSRLLRYALPSIAMMIFSSIYGIVDGFFVSNYAGKTAFAAVNLILPAVFIIATIGFMFGAGGTAIVAARLGEGKKAEANEAFSLIVYFSFLTGLASAVLGFVLMPNIARLLGASGTLLNDCVLYGRINMISMPMFTLQLLFQNFFSTAEKPRLGFFVTVGAGVTNMVMDAVLVTLLPQEWKLAGAAIATVLSEYVGGSVPLIYFARKNKSLLRLGRTRLDWSVIGRAAANGSSEFMNNVSMSLVSMLFNMQLLRFAGESGVAAYGVMMYVSFVFSAVFIGYSMGTAPIVGYHYGKGDPKELRNLRRRSLRIVFVFGLAMLISGELLARPISLLFVGYDAQLANLTTSGLRIFAASFLFMGFGIYGSGFFTALGDGLTSALIAFLRTLVFESAAVMLLPMLFGINGVWSALVVAEVMATGLTAFFMKAKQGKYHY